MITQDSISIAGLSCLFDWLGSKLTVERVSNEKSIVGEEVIDKFDDG